MTNYYKYLKDKTIKGKIPNICELIFLAYAIILILIIPSFVEERLIIGSFFIDIVVRVFIILSLYQSIHFILNLERLISRFFKGVITFRVSELNKGGKIIFVTFSILSGFSAYLILDNLLLFLIPNLGHYSKVFASIFGLFISTPLLVKALFKDQ